MLRLSLTLVCILICNTSAHALGITNGGFETGSLNGWNTTPNTFVTQTFPPSGSPIPGAILPVEGSEMAFLDTSAAPPSTPTVAADVASFLGFTLAELQAPIPVAPGSSSVSLFQGSAISQTFTAQAGDVLSFSWNFLTLDDTPATLANDAALVTLSTAGFSSVTLLADLNSVFLPAQGFEETGFMTFSTTLPTAGQWTLGLSVFDDQDDFFSSGLLVDDVRLASSAAPIPEPATMALMGAGMAGLGYIRRKRRA